MAAMRAGGTPAVRTLQSSIPVLIIELHKLPLRLADSTLLIIGGGLVGHVELPGNRPFISRLIRLATPIPQQ